ncbi:MAG TPA: hypothetical protein P5555_12180 [Candidatus Paceibacterota bacterium]|nr:hypothetical protein [Verrucomicrobiota bacterium]HOX03049.1 hypothetical protein [Verrucomicrobiota bacterium]HRZ45939.1 hypothetical protein [Candidatus Paceibacterota bacterium]
MWGRKRDREQHRYYLLPGMGRSNRQFHRRVLHWALLTGILVSLLIGLALYYLNQLHH